MLLFFSELLLWVMWYWGNTICVGGIMFFALLYSIFLVWFLVYRVSELRVSVDRFVALFLFFFWLWFSYPAGFPYLRDFCFWVG